MSAKKYWGRMTKAQRSAEMRRRMAVRKAKADPPTHQTKERSTDVQIPEAVTAYALG